MPLLSLLLGGQEDLVKEWEFTRKLTTSLSGSAALLYTAGLRVLQFKANRG